MILPDKLKQDSEKVVETGTNMISLTIIEKIG
jgi:hypothetical protein